MFIWFPQIHIYDNRMNNSSSYISPPSFVQNEQVLWFYKHLCHVLKLLLVCGYDLNNLMLCSNCVILCFWWVYIFILTMVSIYAHFDKVYNECLIFVLQNMQMAHSTCSFLIIIKNNTRLICLMGCSNSRMFWIN